MDSSNKQENNVEIHLIGFDKNYIQILKKIVSQNSSSCSPKIKLYIINIDNLNYNKKWFNKEFYDAFIVTNEKEAKRRYLLFSISSQEKNKNKFITSPVNLLKKITHKKYWGNQREIKKYLLKRYKKIFDFKELKNEYDKIKEHEGLSSGPGDQKYMREKIKILKNFLSGKGIEINHKINASIYLAFLYWKEELKSLNLFKLLEKESKKRLNKILIIDDNPFAAIDFFYGNFKFMSPVSNEKYRFFPYYIKVEDNIWKEIENISNDLDNLLEEIYQKYVYVLFNGQNNKEESFGKELLKSKLYGNEIGNFKNINDNKIKVRLESKKELIKQFDYIFLDRVFGEDKEFGNRILNKLIEKGYNKILPYSREKELSYFPFAEKTKWVKWIIKNIIEKLIKEKDKDLLVDEANYYAGYSILGETGEKIKNEKRKIEKKLKLLLKKGFNKIIFSFFDRLQDLFIFLSFSYTRIIPFTNHTIIAFLILGIYYSFIITLSYKFIIPNLWYSLWKWWEVIKFIIIILVFIIPFMLGSLFYKVLKGIRNIILKILAGWNAVIMIAVLILTGMYQIPFLHKFMKIPPVRLNKKIFVPYRIGKLGGLERNIKEGEVFLLFFNGGPNFEYGFQYKVLNNDVIEWNLITKIVPQRKEHEKFLKSCIFTNLINSGNRKPTPIKIYYTNLLNLQNIKEEFYEQRIKKLEIKLIVSNICIGKVDIKTNIYNRSKIKIKKEIIEKRKTIVFRPENIDLQIYSEDYMPFYIFSGEKEIEEDVYIYTNTQYLTNIFKKFVDSKEIREFFSEVNIPKLSLRATNFSNIEEILEEFRKYIKKKYNVTLGLLNEDVSGNNFEYVKNVEEYLDVKGEGNKGGVCLDTAFLLAGVIARAGYIPVLLFIFPERGSGHVLAGCFLRRDFMDSKKKKEKIQGELYKVRLPKSEFIETTTKLSNVTIQALIRKAEDDLSKNNIKTNFKTLLIKGKNNIQSFGICREIGDKLVILVPFNPVLRK